MKYFSPNKKCECFHNCRDIIIIISYYPMYDTRFSYRKVAIEKAAKSESNEGRYFRIFTVFF